MIEAVETLGKQVGVAEACRVLQVPRSSLYQARKPKPEPAPRPTPPRALSAAERARIREIANSERFCDCDPRTIYATLLDEGVYVCDWRTLYRILEEHDEVHERRAQRRAIKRGKPQLRATQPHQVWSWDITQLKGPRRCFYLYTIIDVYSRYVVGWMLATRERGELAEQLIAETCEAEGIEPGTLILHSDRGSAMRSQPVSALLKKLEVTKSCSRPYTPTDNPYSEAHFKTLKFRPDYPGRFDGLEPARDWTRAFVAWYNHEHYHSGLALLTPATVHNGEVEAVLAQRQQVLEAAYAKHPERFVRGKPTVARPPKEVWINQPEKDHAARPSAARPAASAGEPGAQAPSRAQSAASLDGDEHLATLERALDEADDTNIFLPKFEPELSKSP